MGAQDGARVEEAWETRMRERRAQKDAEQAAEDERRRCPYILAAGHRCKGRAKEGHKYCWNHEQYRQRCYAGDFFVPLLEDEATIRLTISHVLQAMVNGQVQPMMARTVVSGCAAALSALRSERGEKRRLAEGAATAAVSESGDDAEDEEVVVGDDGRLTLKDGADRAPEMTPEFLEGVRSQKAPEPVLIDAGYEASLGQKQRGHTVGFERADVEERNPCSLHGLTDEQIADAYYGRITYEEAHAGLTAKKKAAMEKERAEAAGGAGEVGEMQASADDGMGEARRGKPCRSFDCGPEGCQREMRGALRSG